MAISSCKLLIIILICMSTLKKLPLAVLEQYCQISFFRNISPGPWPLHHVDILDKRQCPHESYSSPL